MKKRFTRLMSCVLAVLLLLSQQIPTAAEPAAGAALFDLDTGMTLTDNKNGTWKWSNADGTNVITSVDWNGEIDSRSLTADQGAMVLHQVKTSAYNQRLNMTAPSSFPLTGTTAVGLRFKVAADSYAGALPTVKARLQWGSYYVDAKTAFPLSEETADTWQTLLFTIDPDQKTILGTLDGAEAARATMTQAEASLSGFGIQLIVQNTATDNVEAAVLNTPVTWTLDRYWVTAASPEPPPDGQTLLDISGGMKWNGSTSSIEQTGAIQHQYFNAGADPNFSQKVTGDARFEIAQSLSSGYQHRLLITNPASIPLDQPVTITAKFKIRAADYAAEPFARMSFVRLKQDSNCFVEMAGDIPLSKETEDIWQTITYTIDPDTCAVTGTLNGTAVAQGTLPDKPAALTGLSLFPVVQPKGRANGLADAEALGTTVTWTFDSFLITTGIAGPEPAGDLLKIDDAMTLSGDMLTQTGAIQHQYFNQQADAGFARTLAENGSQFQISQSLSSAYQQRLNITAPASVTLDKTITITVKFKIRAADYGAEPFARMTLVRLEQDNNYFLEMGGDIPLSAETEDTMQTMTYTIDPATCAVTGRLNGAIVAQGTIPGNPAKLAGLSLFPVVQPKSQTSGLADAKALGTTVTWTFDSFLMTKDSGDKPEPAGDLVKIDDAMTLSGDMLSQTGTVQHVYYRSGADSAFTRSLTENGTQFQFSQSLATAYQQRLNIVDPAAIALDDTLTITLRFKIRAADYGAEPFARMMFVRNEPSNGFFLTMGGDIPLSREKEDIWQTLIYTVDPDTCTVTGTLNGDIVAQGTIPDKPAKLTGLGLYPVVQAKGQNGQSDEGGLGTTVTWTIDAISVTKGEDSPEPDIEGIPLEQPVSSGSWQTEPYPSGVGDSERNQLSGKIVDLGVLSKLNKIVLDHDPSNIMSFSVSVSRDGLSYTPVTDVYPGGPKYGGRQIYRIPDTSARYVRYDTVLIEDSETQGILRDMTVSYTALTQIALAGVPDSINPAEQNELRLRAAATDAQDTGYILNPQGVLWTLEEAPAGAALNGAVLTIPFDAAAGGITVRASSPDGHVQAVKSIAVQPAVACRNLVLYGDSALTQPLTSLPAGGTVYASAEIAASGQVSHRDAELILGAYNGSGELLASSTASLAASEIYAPVTVRLELPQGFPADGSVRAYLWQKGTQRPLAQPAGLGCPGLPNGRSLCLPMHGTFQLAAGAGDITWESSDPSVVTVSESGLLSAKSEGTAAVTAKQNGTALTAVQIRVKAGTYVYLLLGQSNMSGTNNPVAEGVDVPISPNVMLLNSGGNFEPAQHPYRRYSGVNFIGDKPPYQGWADAQSQTGPEHGINMGYQFAENMAKAHPDTRIGLVANSSSGCNIITYEKGAEALVPAANGYVNTVARMKQALAGDAVFKGIIWHQGESDQLDTTYPQHLRNLIYDLRTALDAPEVPLILGGLSENNRPAAVSHNTRVKGETAHIPNMAFVSSADPSMIVSRAETPAYQNDPAIWQKDYTHFSAAGQIAYGNRYYQAYLDLTGKH